MSSSSTSPHATATRPAEPSRSTSLSRCLPENVASSTQVNKESTMKLYGFPPSPNTWKVRAVAPHIGIPLELALVDLSKGQQRTPEYLALNPTGRTPTLVDGDLVLWESTAIMHYL